MINYVIKVESEIKNYHYLKIIYINIRNLKGILSTDIGKLYQFVETQLEVIDHFHCKYCLYMMILCYLIKQEMIYDKEDIKRDDLSINKYLYMINPSNLFLRAIFIENFDLKNELKIKFIKSKSNHVYFNQDIFTSSEYHPFELYPIKNFLNRFKGILEYINFLKFLMEQNKNLKIFFEYFFNFIIDFS